MLIASAYLGNRDSVKRCNFEWCVGLSTLFRVESTLTVMVVSTTDNVLLTRQEQSVGASTTDLDDLLFKDIEGLVSDRLAHYRAVSISQLSVLIVTPSVDFSLLNLLRLICIYDLRSISPADDCCEIGST